MLPVGYMFDIAITTIFRIKCTIAQEIRRITKTMFLVHHNPQLNWALIWHWHIITQESMDWSWFCRPDRSLLKIHDIYLGDSRLIWHVTDIITYTLSVCYMFDYGSAYMQFGKMPKAYVSYACNTKHHPHKDISGLI